MDMKQIVEENVELVKGFKAELAERKTNEAELKDRLKTLEQQGAGYSGMPSGGVGRKGQSLSDQVRNHEQFKAFASSNSTSAKMAFDVSSLELKSTTTGTDAVVAPDRQAGIVSGAFKPLTLLDFLPIETTQSNRVEYTRELSFTNSAAETAEANLKPESDLTFELVSDDVVTIAHWLKASRQALADQPALSAFIDQRLRHGVRVRLQNQAIRGNGTSPNMAGLTATGRHTAFTPATGDSPLDSINRAKWALVDADFTPDFVILSPTDVGAMERAKRSDDGYVVGEGDVAPFVRSGLGALVWGLPAVVSSAVTPGEFFVGSSAALALWVRQQVEVAMTESHDVDFTSNLVLVRAEMRAALSVYQPGAILYGQLSS